MDEEKEYKLMEKIIEKKNRSGRREEEVEDVKERKSKRKAANAEKPNE